MSQTGKSSITEALFPQIRRVRNFTVVNFNMAPWIWIMAACIASTIAIIGNTAVIYIIVTRKALRTTANVFICSLAVSDMGIGVSSFLPGTYFINYYISSGGPLQETFDFVCSIFYTASVLNLCMMTADRYIAISFPYKYMSIMSRRCVVFLVTFCWSVPLLTSLIPLTWITSDEKQRSRANNVFYPTISLLFVVTCYLILIPATLHVYLITRKHYKRIHEVNMQLKFNHGYRASFPSTDISSSKLLMIAAVVFILCYSTQLLQEICELSSTCSLNSNVIMFLLLLNSAINPFVYAVHKRDVRKELKHLFKICFKLQANIEVII